MPANRAATFGSWLMWAYNVVLLTSICIGLRQKKISTGVESKVSAKDDYRFYITNNKCIIVKRD